MSAPNLDATCPAVECDCESVRIFPSSVDLIIPGWYLLRDESGNVVLDEEGRQVRVYVGVT